MLLLFVFTVLSVQRLSLRLLVLVPFYTFALVQRGYPQLPSHHLWVSQVLLVLLHFYLLTQSSVGFCSTVNIVIRLGFLNVSNRSYRTYFAAISVIVDGIIDYIRRMLSCYVNLPQVSKGADHAAKRSPTVRALVGNSPQEKFEFNFKLNAGLSSVIFPVSFVRRFLELILWPKLKERLNCSPF